MSRTYVKCMWFRDAGKSSWPLTMDEEIAIIDESLASGNLELPREMLPNLPIRPRGRLLQTEEERPVTPAPDIVVSFGRRVGKRAYKRVGVIIIIVSK